MMRVNLWAIFFRVVVWFVVVAIMGNGCGVFVVSLLFVVCDY